MTITLNSVSQSATAGSASFSVAHTVNAGTNRLMLVFVECPNSTDYMATGTVSYGGTSLGTAVVLPPTLPAQAMYTYVFRMIAPPVGTANVVVTPSATAFLNVKIITLDGVDQATPISASNAARMGFAPNSSYSLPITTPAGGLAVGVFVCRNTTSTIAAIDGATEIGTITSNTASRMIASSKSNTTSLDYSFTGSQPTVGASAVALNAAGGGSTPIAFGGTIPTQTFLAGQSVSVNLATYFTGTQTPFSFASTGTSLTGTGLSITSAGLLTGTANTSNTVGVIVTGTDAGANTASSNAFTITVNAGVTPVSFSGNIPAISGTQNVAITSVDTSTYFTGSLIPFTYTLLSGTLPNGVTLNGSTGVISGTPTVSFTGNIVVRATDTGTNTADSNAITVTISAASADGTITLADLKNNTATPLASTSGFYVTILSATNPKSVVYNTASVSSNASAAITFTNASIVQGTEYRYFIEKDGTAFAAGKVTAT